MIDSQISTMLLLFYNTTKVTGCAFAQENVIAIKSKVDKD